MTQLRLANFRIVYKQQLPNGKKKLREAAVDAENMEEAICIVKQYLKEENIAAGAVVGIVK